MVDIYELALSNKSEEPFKFSSKIHLFNLTIQY